MRALGNTRIPVPGRYCSAPRCESVRSGGFPVNMIGFVELSRQRRCGFFKYEILQFAVCYSSLKSALEAGGLANPDFSHRQDDFCCE